MRFIFLFIAILGAAACGPSIEGDDSSNGGGTSALCCNCPSASGKHFVGSSGTSVAAGGGPTMAECGYTYSHCDDGYTYGVKCTGTTGSYNCQCTHNGPAVKGFTSSAMCDFNSDKARIEAINSACGFGLSTASVATDSYKSF